MLQYRCVKCGQLAEVKPQPALHPSQQAGKIVTCWTRMCANYGQTKDTRDTADIDALFIVEADTSQDDFNLLVLERRARALQRLERS